MLARGFNQTYLDSQGRYSKSFNSCPILRKRLCMCIQKGFDFLFGEGMHPHTERVRYRNKK